MKPMKFWSVLGMLMISCGGNGSGGSGSKSTPALHPLESFIVKVASDRQLPSKIILAIGMHESNLNPRPTSSPYFQIEGETQQKNLGFEMGETAFGISRRALKLGVSEQDIEKQVEAYTEFLKKSLDKVPGLKANPANVNDMFLWLWEISKIQVSSDRNIRAIWVKSVMQLMQQGRVWQDPQQKGLIKLEAVDIAEERLDAQYQALLRLEDDLSDITSARRLDLVSGNLSSPASRPTRVKVIHCPMSIANCLAVQDEARESRIRLGAHYVIPSNESIVSRPLQIRDHERRVQLIGADGSFYDVENAVVVMLVGSSGRYVNGIREDADPTWFSSWQLRKLGTVIRSVCRSLTEQDASVDFARCISVNDTREGVEFLHKGNRATYHWGDIPDFEKSLFATYVGNSDANVQYEIGFKAGEPGRAYKAGNDIQLTAEFSPRSSWIRLQRAVRCQNQQIVWDTVRTDPIRGETRWPGKINVWDAGPNANGQHFLRLLVYGDQNELLGWSIQKLQIDGFDPRFSPPSEACL